VTQQKKVIEQAKCLIFHTEDREIELWLPARNHWTQPPQLGCPVKTSPWWWDVIGQPTWLWKSFGITLRWRLNFQKIQHSGYDMSNYQPKIGCATSATGPVSNVFLSSQSPELCWGGHGGRSTWSICRDAGWGWSSHYPDVANINMGQVALKTPSVHIKIAGIKNVLWIYKDVHQTQILRMNIPKQILNKAFMDVFLDQRSLWILSYWSTAQSLFMDHPIFQLEIISTVSHLFDTKKRLLKCGCHKWILSSEGLAG